MSTSTTTKGDAPAAAPKTESALRREAYSAAEKRLREENRDRFDALVQEEATSRGVTYQRRLTESEKAEQKMRDLLAANPALAEKIAAEVQAAQNA